VQSRVHLMPLHFFSSYAITCQYRCRCLCCYFCAQDIGARTYVWRFLLTPHASGAWTYTRPRIATAARDIRPLQPSYAGRAPSAAASTGHASTHAKELEKFVNKALD
jgi:hypothetical protein